MQAHTFVAWPIFRLTLLDLIVISSFIQRKSGVGTKAANSSPQTRIHLPRPNLQLALERSFLAADSWACCGADRTVDLWQTPLQNQSHSGLLADHSWDLPLKKKDEVNYQIHIHHLGLQSPEAASGTLSPQLGMYKWCTPGHLKLPQQISPTDSEWPI